MRLLQSVGKWNTSKDFVLSSCQVLELYSHKKYEYMLSCLCPNAFFFHIIIVLLMGGFYPCTE